MPKSRDASGRSRPEAGDGAPDIVDLVIGAAADLPRTQTAYDAELLVSTLLGTAYSVAETDRDAAVATLARTMLDRLANRDEPRDVLLRSVVAELTGVPARHPADGSPPWLAQLGAARPTGTYAYSDEYGDQVTYLASFGYEDQAPGGPEHVVVVLVDQNLGFATELFVTAPADAVLARLRADGTGRFEEVPPALLRAEVERHLAATDALTRLPDTESLVTDRLVALARLRLLPTPDLAGAAEAAGRADAATAADAAGDADPGAAGDADPGAAGDADPGAYTESGGPDHGGDAADGPAGPAERTVAMTTDELLAAFAAAPEAARLPAGPTLRFCLDLVLAYAGDRDPLRWSPAAVDLFLLDWVPRRAILDAQDVGRLPVVLSAWVRWAGRVSGLSPRAVAQTVATIARLRPEFVDRVASGDQRSPETQAVAELLADGVDIDDEEAVAAWIAEYNSRPN